MTTFGCPECGRKWQEGPTRDYTENYLCRRCIEALAREAGEALENIKGWMCDRELCGHFTRNEIEGEISPVLTKLRAAGILKGGE